MESLQFLFKIRPKQRKRLSCGLISLAVIDKTGSLIIHRFGSTEILANCCDPKLESFFYPCFPFKSVSLLDNDLTALNVKGELFKPLTDDYLETREPTFPIQKLSFRKRIAQISSGFNGNLFTDIEGSLYFFKPSIDEIPTRLEIPEKVVQISSGDKRACVLTESGRVFLLTFVAYDIRGSNVVDIELDTPEIVERQLRDVKSIAYGDNIEAYVSKDGSVFVDRRRIPMDERVKQVQVDNFARSAYILTVRGELFIYKEELKRIPSDERIVEVSSTEDACAFLTEKGRIFLSTKGRPFEFIPRRLLVQD